MSVVGLGVDPAMGGMGLAVMVDGVPHRTYRVVPFGNKQEQQFFWQTCAALGVYDYDYVAYETPQNGTHKTRAGVVRAAGIAIGVVVASQTTPLRARDVLSFTPSKWRKALGIPTKKKEANLKQLAIDRCYSMWQLSVSHDEAEACLVGYVGYLLWKEQNL